MPAFCMVQVAKAADIPMDMGTSVHPAISSHGWCVVCGDWVATMRMPWHDTYPGSCTQMGLAWPVLCKRQPLLI